MKAVEEEGPPVQLYRTQLEHIGINITQLDRFEEFWQKLFQDRALNQETEAMMLEFVEGKDKIGQFQDYCLLKLKERGLLAIEQKVKKEEENYHIHSPKPIFDLNYELTGVHKNVMMLIISDQQIDEVTILDGNNSYAFKQENKFDCSEFQGYFHILPLNFEFFEGKIKKMSAKVKYSRNSWSKLLFWNKSQQLEYPFENHIQQHLSKVIVKIIHLKQEDQQIALKAFQKKILLWISEKIFEQTEKSMRSQQKEELWKQNWQIWKQVKPWFYLLKQVFKPCEPEDYLLLDKITGDKKMRPEGNFLKFFIWLLKNIFEDQYQSLIQNSSSFVESLKFPDKYQLKLQEQQKFQELIAIEREYLRVFFLIALKLNKKGKTIKSQKAIFKANIEHQRQEYQSQPLLFLTDKLMEELRPLVEDKFMDNRFITLKNFVDKYLVFCRKTDLDALRKNKINLKEEDKLKESKKVLEIMELLQRKCKALPSNVMDIEEEIEQYFFSDAINMIMTIEGGTAQKQYQCRLLDKDFPSFLNISSQISKYQPQIGKTIAQILVSQRSFNMKNALFNDPEGMVKALMNFRQPKLYLFWTQFVFTNHELVNKRINHKTKEELLEFLENQRYLQGNSKNIFVHQLRTQLNKEIERSIGQSPVDVQPEQPLIKSQPLLSQDEQSISEVNFPRIFPNAQPVDKECNIRNVEDAEKLVKPSQPYYYSSSKKKPEFINVDDMVLDKKHDLDLKCEENPNQKNAKILFVIWRKKNVQFLYKNKPESWLKPQKSQMVEIENNPLSFFFFDRFDIYNIKNNLISIDKEAVRFSDLQLDESNLCGLMKINRQERMSSQIACSIEVAMLRYMVKLSEKKMKIIKDWLRLFKRNIARSGIDPEVLVWSMKESFTPSRRQSSLEVEVIYSIVDVVKQLFGEDAMPKLLCIFRDISHIKKIYFNNYLTCFTERQKDQIDIFRLICMLFLRNQFYPQTISIESLKEPLRKGFKMASLPLGKELIRQLIDRQLSKVMVECNQYIIKYCSFSTFVSALETFYARCFYLKDLIGCKKEQQKLTEFQIFLDEVNLKQRKQEIDENKGIKIQIDEQMVVLGLERIFFQHYIEFKDQFENSYFEPIKTIIFSNEHHVQKLFKILKSVKVQKVGNILNRLFHQDLRKKVLEYLKNLQKFQKIMIILLTQPIRNEDDEILEYFVTLMEFQPEMVPKILSICFLQKQKQIDIGKARSVLEKMVKYHPGEAYYKSKVLMDFNSLAMQSETKDISYDFFKMVKAIWSWVQISKDSLLPYLQGSLELNNEKLRNIYLAELCDKMKLFLSERQLQRYLFEQFRSHKQGAQIIRKKIIQTYYSREPKKGLEEMVKETWNCLLNKPNSLEFILYKYDSNYQQIIEKIRSKIEQKDFLIREPQIIIFNKNQISERVQNLFDFTKIENEANHLKMLLVKIKNVKEICQNWEQLALQAKQIQTNIENQLQRLTVKDFHLLISKYQQLSDISPLLKILMNLKEFQKKEVTNVDSLLREFQRTKALIIEKLASVDVMKVREFQELMNYFDERSLQFFLSEAKMNVDGRIVRYKMTLLEDHVQAIRETLSAVNFFLKNRASKKDPPQILIIQRMLQFLDEMEENQSVDVSFKQLEKMNDFLVKQFVNWKEDSAVKVLRATDQCRALFDKMEEVKLSRQKLQHLVQHFNQFQNDSNIHRELQKVFEYWERLKKCKNLKQALKMIEDLINENAQNRLIEKDLEKYIKNCYHSMNWLFQKLKQSSNLEFEFKKELESILKDSKLLVRRSHGGIEVIIRTKKNKIEQDEDEEREFGIKKLVFLREKSMWVESSSRDQPEQNQSNEIQLMKQYSILFKLIDQIRQKCFELVIYSYDPKNLQRELKIFDSKFDQVQNFRNYLQDIESTWVRDIKDTVSRSFILTHFTGNALVNLVESIAQRGSHQGLQMLYQSCNEVIKETEMSKLQKKLRDVKLSLIDKIKQISQILSFDSINRKGEKSQKIKLVTVEEKYFSGYVFKENGMKIPNFNQVLICREDTKIQELQFFLDRAMINSVQSHFIVGVHRVPEDVKNAFCTVMKSKKEGRLKDFEACRLVFIDNDFNNQVVFMLNQPKEFNVEKNVNEESEFVSIADKIHNDLLRSINTSMITSSKAGLGKTHFVEKIGRASNKKVIHFVIPGTIDFESLGNRLKKIQFSGSEILLLKIGFVVNKKNLDIFLTSLIVFRCFFLNEYVCIHPDTEIIIEIENIFSNTITESFQRGTSIEKDIYILNLLKRHKFEEIIEGFDIRQLDIDEMSQREEFVLNFLDHVEKGEESRHLKCFNNMLTVEEVERKIFLLEKYFVDYMVKKHLEPTFHMYKIFMKNLYNNFSTFSNHPFLGTFAHIQQTTDPFYQNLIQKNRESEIKEWYQPMTSEQLSSYRFEFIKTCIQNSLNLVEETYTQNREENEGYRKRTFRQIARDSSMLIISQSSNDKYQFICLNDKEVPRHIKKMNLGQIPELNDQREERINYQFHIDECYEKFCSLNGIKDTKKLQQKMIYILMSLTRHHKYINNEIWFQKELQRMLKDYAITRDNFFKMCLIIQREKCCSPCVIQGESGVGKTALIKFLGKQIYNTELLIFNITAGTHESDLIAMVEKIKKASEALEKKQQQMENKKLWVFFDEFNTTDELSYIKEIMIENRFMGEELPTNIFFIAACNPFRLKQSPVPSAGLVEKNFENQIAFRVNPPPISMIQIMWDYQQLSREENRLYMEKILQKLNFEPKKKLVNVIVELHERIKREVDASAVSLRDVKRFETLYLWFDEYLEKVIEMKRILRNTNKANKDKTAILALTFCYCLRISNETKRREQMNRIEKDMSWPEDSMQKILEEEQKQFLGILKLPDNIVVNRALKENVFTTFVCVMNKIPVLIIGCPGSSKSLSVRIIISNFFGKRSDIDCKIATEYPEINMFYFQGSVSSTSEGVEEIFSRIKMMRKSEEFNFINCIYFDEIGLAEKSPHNPLKVLHSKLEINNEEHDVSFIGISNYALDLSKMSRFLILNRDSPSAEQNKETAGLIYDSLVKNRKSSSIRNKVQSVGLDYSNFLMIYQGVPNARKGLFGLRDFYSMVTEVCQSSIQKGHDADFLEEYYKAICRNFDGQEKSLETFRSLISDMNNQAFSRRHHINHIDMIMSNLENPDSRCLLLIVKRDTLIPFIAKEISAKTKRNVTIIQGSGFKLDESSEEYNSEVTYRVMKSMAIGEIVIFKDINDSIQTSLYDLFNKSFIMRQNKKVCRIAVGANSNPQCYVHPNFNAIVFMDQTKMGSLDLPFLNRFQKHSLSIQNIVGDKSIINLQRWINKITTHPIMKKQNFLFNITEEALTTLVFKYRQVKGDWKEKMMKKQILQNRTTDFDVFLKYNEKQLKGEFADIDGLQDPFNDKDDLIIYTYHQFVDSEERHKYSFLRGSNSIRIAEINSEMSLTDKLKKYLQADIDQKCIITLNFSQHQNLIQQILFLANKIKQQLRSLVQIVVIVQFYRFDFIKNKEIRPTISFLLPFSQYFVERFDVDMKKVCCEAENYLVLFNQLKMEEQMGILFNMAISLMKIVTDDRTSEKIFKKVTDLIKNPASQEQLIIFVKENLKNLRINYQLIHSDLKAIRECPSILEAFEVITKEVTVKVIFIFVEVVVSQNYLNLFDEEMEIEGEPDIYRQKGIKRKELMEELEEIKRAIKQKGEKVFDRIKKQQGSNLVNKKSNGFFFKKTPVFLQRFVLSIRDKENQSEQNTHKLAQSMHPIKENEITESGVDEYKHFSENFRTSLSQGHFSSLNDAFLKIELHPYLLKDVITWKFNTKTLEDLDFLTHFFIEKVESNLLLKMFVLLRPSGHNQVVFEESFSILDIILKYHINLKALLESFDDKIEFEDEAPLEVNGGRFINYILARAVNLLNFTEDNLRNLHRAEKMYNYARQLIDKIFKIDENLINLPSEYMLLKNFYEFLDQIAGDSRGNLIEEFIKYGSKQSIYQNIYEFVKGRMASDPTRHQKYQSFLSLKFFECWIEEYLTKQYNAQQIERCIHLYIDWCNQSAEFANRSFRFFDKLFSEIDQNGSVEIIGEYLNKFGLTAALEGHLKSTHFFTLALNNFFIKTLIKIINEEDILEKNWIFFKQVLTTELNSESLAGNFKIAFLKVYLSGYFNLIEIGASSETMLNIDALLSSEGRLIRYARIFLVKLFKSQNSTEEIMSKFFNCNRCQWILKEKNLIEQTNVESVLLDFIKESCDFRPIETKYGDLFLFKNIKILMKHNYGEENAHLSIVFDYFLKQQRDNLEKSYPLLSFLTSSLQVSQLLENIVKMVKFLSKVHKICNLKIKRHEKRQQIERFIQKKVSIKQREQLLKELKQYISIRNFYREKWQSQQSKHGFDLSFFEKVSNLTKEDSLSQFLIIKNQGDRAERDELSTFLQQIIKIYNNISFSMQGAIEKVNKNSALVQNCQELDPMSINDNVALEELPYESIYFAISIYSNYSVQMGKPRLAFFLSQIQGTLLNKLKPICYLKSDIEKFSSVNFSGEHCNFLSEMKNDITNRTLRDIGKEKTVEEYFKKEKDAKPELFQSTISKIQQNLEIILMYKKNQENKTDVQTLENMYLKCNMSQYVIEELKKEPFSQLPSSCLVDLYEYVESLTFEDLQTLLNQQYNRQILDAKKNAQIEKDLLQLKDTKNEGLQLYDSFKRALNRFVYRKILSQSYPPSENLKDYLCFYNQFWDKGTEMLIKELKGSGLVDLELRYLGSLLKKIREKGKKPESNQLRLQNIPKKKQGHY